MNDLSFLNYVFDDFVEMEEFIIYSGAIKAFGEHFQTWKVLPPGQLAGNTEG